MRDSKFTARHVRCLRCNTVISLVFQVFPEHDHLGETVQEWNCPHCDGTNASSERGRLVKVQPWYGRGPGG